MDDTFLQCSNHESLNELPRPSIPAITSFMKVQEQTDKRKYRSHTQRRLKNGFFRTISPSEVILNVNCQQNPHLISKQFIGHEDICQLIYRKFIEFISPLVRYNQKHKYGRYSLKLNKTHIPERVSRLKSAPQTFSIAFESTTDRPILSVTDKVSKSLWSAARIDKYRTKSPLAEVLMPIGALNE